MPKYNHVEAFCLITYQCQECSHEEVFWNSRDGVTPMFVGCRAGTDCKGTMGHISWNKDACAPDHQPAPGQWIFRDKTVEDAIAEVPKIREAWMGSDYEMDDETFEQMKEAAKDPGNLNGEPWLEQTPELDSSTMKQDVLSCRVCGCTDDDCSGCVERTGKACHWIEPDLCSACQGMVVIDDRKLNLCDRCGNEFATCESEHIMGDGFGGDNVIACRQFDGPCTAGGC